MHLIIGINVVPCLRCLLVSLFTWSRSYLCLVAHLVTYVGSLVGHVARIFSLLASYRCLPCVVTHLACVAAHLVGHVAIWPVSLLALSSCSTRVAVVQLVSLLPWLVTLLLAFAWSPCLLTSCRFSPRPRVAVRLVGHVAPLVGHVARLVGQVTRIVGLFH
jgi:hypothetical protein